MVLVLDRKPFKPTLHVCVCIHTLRVSAQNALISIDIKKKKGENGFFFSSSSGGVVDGLERTDSVEGDR